MHTHAHTRHIYIRADICKADIYMHIHIYTYPHPEMHAYKYIHMHVTGNWATGRGAFDDGGAIFQTVCATRPEIVRTPRK